MSPPPGVGAFKETGANRDGRIECFSADVWLYWALVRVRLADLI
jgi:hypothetical protein